MDIPYIIGLIVFTAFPFVSSFFLSFTEYDLMSPPVFNGIENYRYMLTEDGLFWKSMGVTFAYVFLTIPLKLAFALGIAFVLNFKLRGIGFFRTAYYIPSILGSSVAIAVLWRAVCYRWPAEQLYRRAWLRPGQLARRALAGADVRYPAARLAVRFGDGYLPCGAAERSAITI
jgi:ABC-type spermidine/putrescine transport system permease subunit II